MKAITIKRVFENDLRTYGVIGAVMEDHREEAFGVILELPWRDNRGNISRVWPGCYKATLYKSPRRKGKIVILLKGVPGRRMVEIHIGNTTRDTLGCQIIGESFDWVYRKNRARVRGVLSSRHAMKELLGYLKGAKEFMVIIQDRF